MKTYLFALSFASGLLGTPPQGAYLAQDGHPIAYVPLIQGVGTNVGNAPTNDHQRAIALFTSHTSDDGNSQETTVGVETAVATGYNVAWSSKTIYRRGDNIYIKRGKDSNGVYRQVSKEYCRSGSVRPSGFGDEKQVQVDGTCLWKWINLPNVSAKVGVYSEETVSSGARNTWNLALNTLLKPNTPLSFHANAELDLGNDSAECFGASNCVNLEVKTGGAFRSTHAVLVDSENEGNVYATHFGFRLAGARLSSDADIETDASAAVGVGICSTGYAACSHSLAAIKDSSQSLVGLDLSGKYSAAAIKTKGFMVGYDGFVKSDAQVSAESFSEKLFTPPSSSFNCETGRFADDKNFHYVCVSSNHWRRVGLQDF